MNRPRIALITPVLNRAGMLGAALASARAQADDLFEHIAVDGGSTDGTLDMLRGAPGLRLIEGPDAGLYDAIDKGVAASSADIIGLLNSDDLIEPGALAAVRRAFAKHPQADIVSGGALYARPVDGGTDDIFGVVEDAATTSMAPAAIIAGIPIINARFYRRSFVERIGRFDLRFKVVADRDWLIRCIAAQAVNVVIPERLYRYRWHAGSLTIFEHDPLKQNARDLEAATARLAERHAGQLGALYRDWHAWTTGYQALALARRGRYRETLAATGAGFARDPLWPTRFAPLALAHAGTRRARFRTIEPAAPTSHVSRTEP